MKMLKNRFLLKVILLFCLNVVACSNESTDSVGYFDKGVTFFQQDEFDKARIEFKNAIQQDPQMAEAHFYMALLNEKAGKFKAMKMNLIESMKFDSENIKAKIKLSKVSLLFNETDKSLQEIEDVLITNPENLDALSLKASIFLRQDKTDKALAIVEDVLKKDAENVEALSLKVLIFMKKNAFDEALAILNPVLQKNEQNISLHLLKIQLNSKRDDIDAVIADYEKLVELKPENTQIKLILAKIYVRANKKQEAENLLRSMISDNTKSDDLKIQLLGFLYSEDRGRALSQLEHFIKENKDNVALHIMFSKWLIANKEASKARELLTKTLKIDAINQQSQDDVKLILAKLDFTKKDYKSALSQVKNILAENPENLQARLFKAKTLTIGESYNEAIEIIEKILWQDPRMDEAHSLLGTIHLTLGDIDKANASFKEALKFNPKNLIALDFIVNKEVTNNHVDYAIELLERALRFLPSHLAILTKLVELNIIENHWDKADHYINIIKTKRGGGLLSEILMGKTLQGKNKYDEAILIYKKILDDSPWVKEALTGMAECYTELNQINKMKQYLDILIDKNPEVYYPFILKSRLLSRDGKNLKAIQLIKQALANRTVKEAGLYIELARLYKLIANKEERFNTYTQGLSDHPDNIGLLLNFATYFESYSEFDQAIKQYRRVLQINSQQNIAKNNLAVILLDQYQDAEHLNEAIKLVDVFKQSSQAYFLDTYGWAYLKKGEIDIALSIFKQVILLEPDVPVFRYHLAEAYFRLNDFMAASSELKQALQFAKGKAFPKRGATEELLKKVKNR